VTSAQAYQTLMVTKVLFGHPLRRKALLETRTYLPPVEFAKPADGLNSFRFPILRNHGRTGRS
jgi:hypothetical protein